MRRKFLVAVSTDFGSGPLISSFHRYLSLICFTISFGLRRLGSGDGSFGKLKSTWGFKRSQEGDGRGRTRRHEHLAAKQMFTGAISGALADGTMYPMMTVKSRLQVQGGSGGGTAAMYMYRGLVQAIQTIVAKEGWRIFYKGYAIVTQVAPTQALYFATYQAIKRWT